MARLGARVDAMVARGLVDEARAFVGPAPSATDDDSTATNDGGSGGARDGKLGLAQAIGYKEFMPYFAAEAEAAAGAGGEGGGASAGAGASAAAAEGVLASCVERLKIHHRQYAKRQVTWIRGRVLGRGVPVYRLDGTDAGAWDAAAVSYTHLTLPTKA